MSDVIEHTETVVEAPAKRKAPKKKAKAKRAPRAAVSTKDEPVKGGEFAGISATQCPAACTADRCVISTVGVCKHPFKTADNGCGPVTMANRERARKLIKHQMIDLKG